MKKDRKTFFNRRVLPLIVAFLVPVVVLLLIYVMRGIYPFGDEMYLRSDMYHQYAPFLKLFQSTLKRGGSLLYTWNIGLGSNFLSTYAYYLASPVNWITALLSPNHIPEIMSAFIFLKSGLMSVSMTWYLEKHFKRYDLIAPAFGIFYALSGYMAAYSWNVMWLDCLILLPLMMLGLERLVKEGRFLLYTICFALSVLSNYYIAIMLCIFSGLYFIYLMAAEAAHRGKADVFGKICRYLLYTLIGGLIGAAVFLPALFTLFHTASAGSSFPSVMKAYFNLMELFAHGMMNVDVTMMDGYVPNIYCGIAAFALVPLYWMNRGVSVKERVGKTVLLGVMLFSFAFNVPSFIWHGFHFPNSLPSRQSFLYIFLVLVIGYEAMLRVRNNKKREILLCFAAAIAAVFVLQVLYDNEAHPLSAAYISAAFLVVYGIALLLRRKSFQKGRISQTTSRGETVAKGRTLLDKTGKALSIAATALILVACFSETLINMDATGYGTTSRVYYTEDNEAISELLSGIPDEDFYRVEKYSRRTKNDGAWSGYRSASIFSSVTTEALSDAYESLGMQYGTNAFSYYGNTPFSSALLSVRYKLAEGEVQDPFADYVAEKDGICLYRNRYCLPPGFMVDRTTKAEVDPSATDPFEVQNDFVDAAVGGAPLFAIGEKLSGASIRYTAEADGPLYFYIDREVETLTITKLSGPDAESSRSFSDLECDMIIFAGEVKLGDEMELSITEEEVSEFGATPAVLDEEALSNAIAALSYESLAVSSFTDDSMEGQVTASEDGLLFTGIPYDSGWKVTVDGKRAETDDFYGAFLMVPLKAGTHTVSFHYEAPGHLIGLIVSILALIALIILTVLSKVEKKKRN